MVKKYIVRLSEEERKDLEDLCNKGRVTARKRRHAEILLKAAQGEYGPAWNDGKIAETFNIGRCTVERVRQRLVEEGLEAALNERQKSRHRGKKLDGENEARLVALAGSEPPEGCARWPLKLLAERRVELEYVESISDEAVRPALKKTELKPWLKKQGCIPPEANAEFVCAMEDILEIYCGEYDENNPLICMDEASKQLVAEVRTPIPAQPGEPEKFDAEYERNGVSSIFRFSEPLTGKGLVKVSETRTAVDWAHQIKELVEARYPNAERITLGMDNRNTHGGASLYKAFEPVEARRIFEKLDLHYTPKHGSWLNLAEINLSILSSQCLDRRIPNRETLAREVKAWEARHNASPAPVKWRFTTEDARVKLKRLYPSI